MPSPTPSPSASPRPASWPRPTRRTAHRLWSPAPAGMTTLPEEAAGHATIVIRRHGQARPPHDPPRLRQVRARGPHLRARPARRPGAPGRTPYLRARRRAHRTRGRLPLGAGDPRGRRDRARRGGRAAAPPPGRGDGPGKPAALGELAGAKAPPPL